MTATTQAQIRRHPIRGALYGIVFGLGLALVAIGQGFAALGTWPPFLLLLLGIALGVTWAMLAPPKGAAQPDAPRDDPPQDEPALDGDSEIA